jgi:uncharacterized membrane protein
MNLNTSLAWLRRNPIVILYFFIILVALILSFFSILKHYAFKSTAWDLGIYEQVLWSTVNGRFFWYTPEILINPSCNFFGIHFAPILLLVLPIYAVFQTTETILILQAFSLAIAAVPLYKLVLYESGSNKQALLFGLIYLAYPPIYGLAFFDFHVQAFLPFLFFSAFYFFKKEEWGKFFVFIILSLMVIEFVPLMVVFFGIYGLWTKRRSIFHFVKVLDFRGFLHDSRIFYSIITIVLGFVWFIVARFVSLSINPTAPPHPNWKIFGDPTRDPLGFAFTLLANPVKTLEALLTPVDLKLLYIFGLFAPLAFLSFLDLPSLMIGAPWFFVAFLSDYSAYYVPIGYQYVAFVTPFVFISAVYGVKRLFSLKYRFGFRRKLGFFSGKAVKLRHWKALVIIILILATAVVYIRVLDIHLVVPEVTEHDRVAEVFANLIPSNASVLTQNDLFPHISKRLYAYAVVGGISQNFTASNITFDYIFVDTKSPWYGSSLEGVVYNLTRNGSFRVQYAADGIWLLKRNYTDETFYPVEEKGVFVDFYNQGVLVKLFNSTSSKDKPAYENVSSSLIGTFGLGIPETWRETGSFGLAFEGWLYVPINGTYVFQLENIGSSRVYINDEQILYSEGSGSQDVVSSTYTVALERGFNSIKIAYRRENNALPLVHLLWKPPWESKITDIQSAFLYSKNSSDVSSPFLDLDLDFDSQYPFVSINKQYFSVFLNCSMYAPTSGMYRFNVSAAGNASVSIDGRLVFSPFEDSNETVFEVSLSQGNHVFQIDYLNVQEDAYLHVAWQPPESDVFEEIPLNNLSWQKG